MITPSTWGNTLQEIAIEKAGVFKRGAVAVIGEHRPETQLVLEQQAQRHGASSIAMIDRDFRVSDISVDANGTTFTHEFGHSRETLRTSLTGDFQAGNAAVALAMLRGAGGKWADAATHASRYLGDVHIAGRFHRVGKYLFDVAHNPDGAATVVANLIDLNLPKPIVAVVSVLRDKDWRGILTALSTAAEHIVLTNAPTAPESRAWNGDEALAWAEASGLSVTLQRNFDQALRVATEKGATVLITGSFHTVGDAMERLQVDPLAR